MRITAVVLMGLVACGSMESPRPPSSASSRGAGWQDVVGAAGEARDPAACSARDRDVGAALESFGEQQALLKRRPDDAEAARAVRQVGRRWQREGASLLDVAIGDSLVADAESRLTELGQPIPRDPAPPLIGALAAELLCAVATVEQMRDDPEYAGEHIDSEIANTRRLALAYFDEVRAAGDDPFALQQLVEPAEARASSTTPAASFVLENVPRRYADLSRDRAARR